MNFQELRQFLRDNPRVWIAGSLAVLVTILVVWAVYGGFGFGFSRFFAASEPGGGGGGGSATPTPSGGGGGATPTPGGGGGTNYGTCNAANTSATCALGCSASQHPGSTSPDTLGCTNGATCCVNKPSGLSSSLWAVADGRWFTAGRYDPNCPAAVPYRTERTGNYPGSPGDFTCVEKPQDCPDGFHAVGASTCAANSSGGGGTPAPAPGGGGGGGTGNACFDNCFANILPGNGSGCTAYCAAGGGTTSPAPTTTPAPSAAQGPPVSCAPQSQTVGLNQPASADAVGGIGTYQWNVTGGGIVQSGGNESISVAYNTPGTKTLRVNSGGQSGICTIVVLQGAAGGPTVAAPVTVEKLARDMGTGEQTPTAQVTVDPGSIIQFVVNVKSVSSVPLTNITVHDTVPAGMTYRAGSTYVQGTPITVETLTTTGLALGTLDPNDEFTIRWAAVADQTGRLLAGRQVLRPPVTVSADNVAAVTADMTVNILGTGTGATATGPGGVATGPGDAVVLALTAAAAMTLLYTAYTRSGAFHRKEIERITRQRDPMDFRS